MTKRWSETQHLVAGWFAARGWPYAEAVGNGRQGADVTGMPGLACEVKAVEKDRMGAWLRQAGKIPGVPFVVWRPPGQGPATVGQWPVIVRLDTFTALLQAAGYGDDKERTA